MVCGWRRYGTNREHTSGETLASAYKKHDLAMLPQHATWPDGGVSTEAGILEMDERMRTGRFKVGDEVFGVGPHDVVFVPPHSMRSWEAGDDGMALIAFGGHTEGAGADMDQEFWPA